MNGATIPPSKAIDYVVDLVEAELRQDGRHWNDDTLEEQLGYVDELLEAAMSGNLQPIDEIKPLQRPSPRRLFELRFEVRTEYRLSVGKQVGHREFKDEPLRIYHGESSALPFHALGLHLHIKRLDGDIENDQNGEIDHAIKVFDDGEPDEWGLPR